MSTIDEKTLILIEIHGKASQQVKDALAAIVESAFYRYGFEVKNTPVENCTPGKLLNALEESRNTTAIAVNPCPLESVSSSEKPVSEHIKEVAADMAKYGLIVPKEPVDATPKKEALELIERLLPNSLPTGPVKIILSDRASHLDPLDFHLMEPHPLLKKEPDKIPALSGPNGLEIRVRKLAEEALKEMVDEGQIKVRFAYPDEAQVLLGIEDESAYIPDTVIVQVAKDGKAGEFTSRGIIEALRDRLVKGGNQADLITHSFGGLLEPQALVLNHDKVVVLLRG